MVTKKKSSPPPYNVLEHFLNPDFAIVEKNEATKIINQYGGNPFNFPIMLSTDPSAEAIGAQTGDLVKVIRKSSTNITSIYYGFIVEGGIIWQKLQLLNLILTPGLLLNNFLKKKD